MDFHFLFIVSASSLGISDNSTAYHFEGIEFFLDLLCKHRRKPVACGNVTSAVVVMW